jgi:hypothetical protein
MTLGATRLLFLDSGEDKPDENKEYSGLVEFQPYIEQQIRWLEEEIASVEFKSARWRVVVVHMPPHWNKEEERLRFYDKHMREQFAPLFDRGGVTAVISGHTHRMELVEPCPDKARGFQWPVFIGGAPKLEDAAVIRVDADNSTLYIRGYRADGSIFAEKSWK